MSDLPQPAFSIGQVVYYPFVERVIEKITCPDCLGSQKWAVTTPAGTEMTTPCQRCSGYSCISDLPRPEKVVVVPSCRRLTIGSIEAKTHGNYSSEALVRYMCNETGIGSGTIYDEGRLFSDEAGAMEAARVEAREIFATEAAKPSVMAARALDFLTVKDAVIEAANSSRWDAWYAYRRLSEEVKGLVEDNYNQFSRDEIVERLHDILSFDGRYKGLPQIGQALVKLRDMVGESPEAEALFAVLATPAREGAPA